MGKRSNYVDILKALGIISIVVGHASTGILNAFVYSYHLMIFFFVVGLCFSDEKAKSPEKFFGKYILKLLLLYIGYNAFFVIFHNLFVTMNLTAGRWDNRQIIEALFYPLTFTSASPFLGAFWFIPMFLCGIFIYIVTFSFAIKTKHPDWVHMILMLVWAILALLMNQYGMVFGYHIQTSFLAVPIIYAGYYVKRFQAKLDRYINIPGCVASAAIIILALHFIGRIELSANQIASVWSFYPITFTGIYFCCSLAKVLHHLKISKMIGYIGRNSFHIMAMHFLAFKLVDILYGAFSGITDPAILSRYPHSNFPVHILYWLAGVFFPLGFVALIKKVGEGLGKKFGIVSAT